MISLQKCLWIYSIIFVSPVFCVDYRLSGPVNDYAGVLSSVENQSLTAFLLGEEQKTGNQLVILTVPKLVDQTIEQLALDFFNTHQLGKKNKDNGVLIAAAIGDRAVRIEVGYGLEGRLTDAQSWSIIKNQIGPEFKEKRYFNGLLKASEKIHQIIAGEFENNDSEQGYPWFYYFLAYLLIILVAFFFIGLIFGPPEFDEDEIGPAIIKSSLWIFFIYAAGIAIFASIFGFFGTKFIAWPALLSLSTIFCATGLIFKPFRVLVTLGIYLFFSTLFKKWLAIIQEMGKNDDNFHPPHNGGGGGFGSNQNYSSGGSSSSGSGYSGGGGRSGGGGASGGW